jgi:eukaryotic-like serine/threonine-protein kinase
MPLEPGARLGPYEILKSMESRQGERYQASDTRSDRMVAITVLPEGLAARPETKARIERDSQVISSLRPSDISGPVEVGHQEPSIDFVVAEYIEGETLGARLARGPMPLSEVLGTAIRIAQSLDRAHRKGIVHGGLTPSGVILTDDGPKLVDFGLGGLLEEASEPAASGPQGGADAAPAAPPSLATTRTLGSSLVGAPVTRARYQAPEQLDGAPADPRSDVFALGAVLYEMLTGRPAFDEKTQALLVAAVQTVDPEPVSSLQPMATRALDHVVGRALAKDPRQRLQTARDLARQLEWIGAGGSEVGVPVPVAARKRVRERVVWAGLAVGLVAAISLLPSAADYFRSPPERGAAIFNVPGLSPAVGVPISVSPDGRWVVGSGGGVNTGVIGIHLDSVTPQMIGTGNVITQPFWSPDSRSIAFFEEGLLKRIEIAGGSAETIVEATPPIGGGTWNQDGVILFASGGVIHRVLAAGGEATPVTSLDETLGETDHLGPYFLPDGRHYLFTAISNDSAIYVGELGSTERTRLVAAESKPVYAEPGYILFNRADTLFAQPFDPDAQTLTGEPLRVTDGLPLLIQHTLATPNMVRTANFAASRTGVLVFKRDPSAANDGGAGNVQLRSLEWRQRSGAVEAVGPTGGYAGIDLSPDGTRFAFHLHESDGGDVWTFDLARGREQRLTFDASEHNASPVFSPDGERIAFGSRRGNQWGLYLKRADGTGGEELIFESEVPKMPMSWSPDQTLLVYSQGADVWAVPLDGGGEPFPVLDESYNEFFPTVSPTGDWIAYQSDETGQAEIYVQQFPEGPAKFQVSRAGGFMPRWRGDGRELYFVLAPSMWAVGIEIDGESLRPGIPESLFPLGGDPNLAATHPLYHRYAVTSDGERFLISRPGDAAAGGGGEIDAAIAAEVDQNSSANLSSADPATVVVNWPQMLEER